MAKVAKSIRIDQKVFAYIEKYKGEGFNEKFENIITDAMESEQKRLDKIKQLDKQVDEKEKQLRKAMGEVNRLQDVSSKVTSLLRTCKEIEERIEMKIS
jgi:flagellar capping protein FliD